MSMTKLEAMLQKAVEAEIAKRNSKATAAIIAIGRELERDGQFCGADCKSHPACRES